MVEVLMSAVVGELSAWQTKWETNGQTFFYKYKDKEDKDYAGFVARNYETFVIRLEWLVIATLYAF